MLNKIKEFILAFALTIVDSLPAVILACTAIAGIGYAINVTTKRHAPERSIVAVLNKAQTGGGTGFAVKLPKTGATVIVTNEHVCRVAENGLVRIKTDSGRVYIRKVLAENAERDLCVVEGINIPALTLGQSPPNRFDEITVLGHPYLTPTVYSKGQYSHDEIVQVGAMSADGSCPKGSEAQDSLFFTICVREMEESFTTITIYPGNSGSPVLNSEGHVIGVINIADSRMNRGAFVSLEYLLQTLYAL
jgi:S1-C subfamily serine protease